MPHSPKSTPWTWTQRWFRLWPTCMCTASPVCVGAWHRRPPPPSTIGGRRCARAHAPWGAACTRARTSKRMCTNPHFAMADAVKTNGLTPKQGVHQRPRQPRNWPMQKCDDSTSVMVGMRWTHHICSRSKHVGAISGALNSMTNDL